MNFRAHSYLPILFSAYANSKTLANQLCFLLDATMAVTTELTLQSQCKIYFKFCTLFGFTFTFLPASTSTLSLYIAYLANCTSMNTGKKLECSTATSYVASLSSLHLLEGFQPPELFHPLIPNVSAGRRRIRLEFPNRKKGITLDYLIAIIKNLAAAELSKRNYFGVHVSCRISRC